MCEGYAKILIVASGGFDFAVAVVTLHAFAKGLAWEKVQEL
jgi:hypothetical protein